jgi:pyruvate formate lyase activating enzyme
MSAPVLGQINKILPQSFVDGPGNRSVVFLQGCNFQCLYCHNPYTINRCNACGVCVGSCPVGALRLEGDGVRWDAEICQDCETCLDVCPNFSSPRIWSLTSEQTWERLKPNAVFVSGVTVTGGEPTQQPEFLSGFLKEIKAESDLDTCIETNGDVSDEILAELLPILDYVMVDLKAFDSQMHQALTGRDNAQTLTSLRTICDAGKLHMVRTTVVPGYTNSEDNIAATARFLAGLDPGIHLRLLRFRPHGTRGDAATWGSPSDEEMDHLVEVAKQNGLKNTDRSI